MTGTSPSDPPRFREQAALGARILQNCRAELYSLFPYLDGAFACLGYSPRRDGSVGTDGARLLFHPPFLLRLYRQSPAAARRGYLHILLHCLFLHLFDKPAEPRLWDLACDMAVERLIEKQHHSRLALEPSPVRSACFALLGEQNRPAQEIAGLLRDGFFPFPFDDLETAFRFDDHALWREADGGLRKTWERALAYAGAGRTGKGRAGSLAGAASETFEGPQRGAYRYSRYLRRFTVQREEAELDLNSFDYIFYHLGMERYGNMPLLEPLEYKEGNKLEELVIAIDTSGSCSRETVSRFLSETYAILGASENFFRRMTVYLIQCDCMVQSAAVIRSPEDWARQSRQIVIQGRGGTDFTPVFRYVDKLRAEKKLKNLRALLYFTDGDGFYPSEKTAYETAFVFLEKNAHLDKVPPWAVRLVVGEGVIRA